MDATHLVRASWAVVRLRRSAAGPGRQAQWEERRLCRRLARAPEPCRPVASPLPTTSPEEGKRGVPRPEPAVPCGGAGAERSRAEPGSQHCPRGGCPQGASRPGLRLGVLACRCLHLCLMISGQCLRRVRLALRCRGCRGCHRPSWVVSNQGVRRWMRLRAGLPGLPEASQRLSSACGCALRRAAAGRAARAAARPLGCCCARGPPISR